MDYKRIDISLTDYCRSVTIVTNNPNEHFHSKIYQFHPKTVQFRHFFEIKMFKIYKIPLGSNQLKIRPTLPILILGKIHDSFIKWHTCISQCSNTFIGLEQFSATWGPYKDSRGPQGVRESI